MEVDNDQAAGAVVPTDEAPAPVFSLNLLQLVRTEQSQNGVKHGDYMRYRQHCARKLHSLFKVLKFLHGKGRYTRRKIEPATVSDVRFIHIVLFYAERAWAYAMELKKECEARMHLRKRHHMLKRLAKAAVWAKEVARLCAERCDTRTQLEADAYAAWMHGIQLLEREKSWEVALAKLTRAKKLWSELAKLSDLQQQSLCLQMVEEIEPSIRYCNYQISRKGGSVPDASELLALAGGAEHGHGAAGLDMLQSKLAALAQEAQVAQAASTTFLEWSGRKIPVRNERIKLSLHKANECSAQLQSSMDVEPVAAEAADAAAASASALDGKLALYDRMINALRDAKSQATNAIKAHTAAEGEVALAELTALESGLQGTLLQRTVDRAQLMVADAEARFAATLERQSQGKKSKEKGASARPEDVVRLLDMLARSLQEMAELGVQTGGRQGEALHDAMTAKVTVCQASRCYYVAHAYLAGGKAVEAYAMFARTIERIAQAEARLSELPERDSQSESTLKQLAITAAAYRAVSHAEAAAHVVKEQESVEKGVGSMALEQQQQHQQVPTYLLDALEEWQSFAGQPGGKVAPRVANLPFAMQAIPVRPIMLDTASNYLNYPSLEHRTSKTTGRGAAAGGEKRAGVLSSLAGWAWGSSAAKK